MLAYISLRRNKEFLDEAQQRKLDIAHAENGLVVMTAGGLFVASALVARHRCCDSNGIGWIPLLIAGIVFWIASYFMATEQHKLECMHWRYKEAKDGGVKKTLIESGILDRPKEPADS